MRSHIAAASAAAALMPVGGAASQEEGMGILEIGEDYILARVRDELGVDYVQVWPLERGDG